MRDPRCLVGWHRYAPEQASYVWMMAAWFAVRHCQRCGRVQTRFVRNAWETNDDR